MILYCIGFHKGLFGNMILFVTVSALLTVKRPSKTAADKTFFIFFYFNLLKKIRLDVSCESSV